MLKVDVIYVLLRYFCVN